MQQSYVYAVSRLAKHHHKSPDQLSKEDIRALLVHLTVERKLSPNSLTGYCLPSVLEATATERGLCCDPSRQAPVIDGLSHAGRLTGVLDNGDLQPLGPSLR